MIPFVGIIDLTFTNRSRLLYEYELVLTELGLFNDVILNLNSFFFLLSTDCTFMPLASSILLMIFLVFEGLLFGIFTLVMLCSQVTSVVRDETVSLESFRYILHSRIRKQMNSEGFGIIALSYPPTNSKCSELSASFCYKKPLTWCQG